MPLGATPAMDHLFTIERTGEVLPAMLGCHDLEIGIAWPLSSTDRAPSAAFHMIWSGLPPMTFSATPSQGLQSALIGRGKQLATTFMCQIPKGLQGQAAPEP